MYSLKEIASFVQTLAPLELAESWDNVGTLVRCDDDITGVLCALDITADAIAQAKAQKCNLIVSHHPVIFKPLRHIAQDDVPALLLCNGISAVCAHTNLDAAPGGVNDVLAGALGLRDVQPFAALGRVGVLPKSTAPMQFAQDVAKALDARVQLADASLPILTVAVVSGSGGSFVPQAVEAGVDCLVTGEAGHHDALDALAGGVSLIAASHFSTEIGIAPVLAQKIQKAFPDLHVVCSTCERDPFISI